MPSVSLTHCNIAANGNFYAEATCGNITAYVGISAHGVAVTCYNASAMAWRRHGGRVFRTTSEAIDGYKKKEMKAIISEVTRIKAEWNTAQCSDPN